LTSSFEVIAQTWLVFPSIMENDMRVNLLTLCGVRALHRAVDPNEYIRDLSERDCDNPKVSPALSA
jgi:hypothetical protein